MEVHSPTEFVLGSYTVHWTAQTRMNVQRGRQLLSGPVHPEQLRVGERIDVEGQVDETKGYVDAGVITVARTIEEATQVSGTALIQQAPQLKQCGTGWSGILVADGRHLLLDAATATSFAKDGGALNSLAHVSTNMFIQYSGVEDENGDVHLKRAAFFGNTVSATEAKLRKSREPLDLRMPDYDKNVAGEIKIKKLKPITVVPDRAMQERLNRIGQALIPAYQKQLAAEDPTKIEFRFFATESKYKSAVALENGMVFIPARQVLQLQNDAQLASYLAFCIARVLEKQSYSELRHGNVMAAGDAGALALDAAGVVPLLGSAAMIAGHEEAKHLLHEHNAQATRVMLDYMAAAGYDLREAAAASRILDGPTESQFAKNPDTDKATALIMERIRSRYAAAEPTPASGRLQLRSDCARNEEN